MKTIKRTSGILLLALAASQCAINPVTGDRDFVTVSEAQEIQQGRKYHQSIIARYGVYDDATLQQYLDMLGQELAKNSHRSHLKFTFTLLDSPEINAFALPGGYVYVTRGIMAYLGSEAELAGVLGHEIGHVTARHSVRQQSGQFATTLLNVLITATTGNESLGDLSNQLSTGIVRGYGRKHELEADKLGARYLHKAGYDPEAMLDVIGVLKNQEVYEKALAKKENRSANIYHGVFSTHPKNDERLKTVVRAAKKLSDIKYRDSNQAGYYAMIDGMVWGQSIKHGVVEDNRFSHPQLAFALQLPAGWKVNNNPEVLEARNPETGAVVQISLTARNQDESLSGLLKRMVNNKNLKVFKEPHGVSAKTKIKPQDGKPQPARISAIELDNLQVLTLLGTAQENHFTDTYQKLIAIDRSFTRLTRQQIDAIKSPRLRIVDGNTHSSFNSLAQQSAISFNAASILRLLNRAFPSGKITELDKLKTVTFDD